jgi:Tol biopolymer transport system component
MIRGGNAATRQLAWRDRKGEPRGVIGYADGDENPRLSPDGKRLAVFRPDNGGDIWITDLEHNSSSRFTFNPAVDNVPLWSPRGDRIAFISNRDGGVFNIYAKNLTGDEGDEAVEDAQRQDPQ